MLQDQLFFLNHQNFGIYSRPLAKALNSLAAAVLLSELVEKRHNLAEKEMLYHDEKTGKNWFYYTLEDMEERTTLSRKEQDTAIKILKEKGLIEVSVIGMPPRRHFILNDQKIIDIILNSKKVYNLPETDKLNCPKRTNQYDRKGQIAHIRDIENIYNKKQDKYIATRAENRQIESSHTASPIRAKDFFFSFEKMKFEGITPKDIEDWRQLFPNISLDTEILKAEQWLKSNPSKSNKKLWRKFLVGWFNKAQEKAYNQKAFQSFNSKVDRKTKNKDGTPVEPPYENLF